MEERIWTKNFHIKEDRPAKPDCLPNFDAALDKIENDGSPPRFFFFLISRGLEEEGTNYISISFPVSVSSVLVLETRRVSSPVQTDKLGLNVSSCCDENVRDEEV